MKIEEVPQDKGFLVEGRISDLSYAVDTHGQYVSTQSMGWKPKNEAMTLAWSLVHEKAEEARQKVLEGEWSPLAFYMELKIMDVKILAGYTGIAAWRVRKHLKMKYFKKIKPEILAQYATALEMQAEDMVNLDIIREIKLRNED
jgi:hypothetical protein